MSMKAILPVNLSLIALQPVAPGALVTHFCHLFINEEVSYRIIPSIVELKKSSMN